MLFLMMTFISGAIHYICAQGVAIWLPQWFKKIFVPTVTSLGSIAGGLTALTLI